MTDTTSPHRPAEDPRDRLGRPLLRLLRPFYRRYPCESPVSIFHLDMRGAYSPQEPVFYNRIPKAANSTVMTVLAQHSTFSRAGATRAKSRMLRPSRMTAAQVAGLAAGEAFRFTFVRDPYARVLSAYRDKILGAKRQLDRHFRVAPGGSVPTFTEFCRFLADRGLWLDAHWAPQADLLLLPPDDFDLIGRVETLDRDLTTVVARVFGATHDQGRRAGPVTDATDRVASDYTDEARAIVARLYRRDFDIFGYPT